MRPYLFAATVLLAAATSAYPQARNRNQGDQGAVQRWPTRGAQQGAPAPSRGARAAAPRESNSGQREAARQEARPQQRPGVEAFRPRTSPREARQGGDTFRQAVPRNPGAPRETVLLDTPQIRETPPATRSPQGQGNGRPFFADQRRAEPRGSRPRGDNPATGVAVPRGARQAPATRSRDGRNDGRYGYVRPRGIYNNYYYYNNYPRRYYPYGYGGFGLGFFYYDPYVWRSNSWGYYGSSGYPYLGYGNGYDLGHLRLQVRPRDAEVYVDGYYAGTVDDFDGRFQGMALESGGYTVEIVAPGYEPLRFDIRITPDRTTTYRGDLLPQP